MIFENGKAACECPRWPQQAPDRHDAQGHLANRSQYRSRLYHRNRRISPGLKTGLNPQISLTCRDQRIGITIHPMAYFAFRNSETQPHPQVTRVVNTIASDNGRGAKGRATHACPTDPSGAAPSWRPLKPLPDVGL
jgi:hypothetical protein